MAISKKLRFEILKRDGFKCAYCGKTPPDVTLEIDHINPKSKKGSNDINNLITACFECNRGKRNITLDKIPNQMALNVEILKERELQLKEYNKMIEKINKRIDADIEKINDIYWNHYEIWRLADNFKIVSLKRFVKELPIHEVVEAMNIAIDRFYEKSEENADNAIKYFCGICWKKIRNKNE